ncbi:hypothetical protein ABT329_29620, partial [Streptomyces minutiscleroticus]
MPATDDVESRACGSKWLSEQGVEGIVAERVTAAYRPRPVGLEEVRNADRGVGVGGGVRRCLRYRPGLAYLEATGSGHGFESLAERRALSAVHWRHADELARRHPRAVVEPDVLYVDE